MLKNYDCGKNDICPYYWEEINGDIFLRVWINDFSEVEDFKYIVDIKRDDKVIELIKTEDIDEVRDVLDIIFNMMGKKYEG